jgi:hypothetical protein
MIPEHFDICPLIASAVLESWVIAAPSQVFTACYSRREGKTQETPVK